ncbi:MAG: DUF4013 domain-containing protein [Pirellulales bacterium]
MSMDPNNPYASSPVGGATPGYTGPSGSLDFGAAIKAPLNGEGAIVSILLSGLCLLFGCFIVPAMILFGYAYECAEQMIVSGGTHYLQFDTNRAGKYLARGWVPWVVALVFGIAVQCINYAVQFGVMGLMMAGGGQDAEQANLVGSLVSIPVSLFINFLFYFVITPASLQAGLTQDIGKAFDFGWAFDFISKMWKELLLCYVVTIGVGIVAYIAGLLMLCIGIIFGLAYLILFSVMLQAQMYSIYLSRGGRPLPFKQDPTSMPTYGPGPGQGSNPFI